MLDNQLNRQASMLVSVQKEDSCSTQLAPRRKISILNHICLDEEKKFNNIEKLTEKVCILDDYPKFLDKVIRDYFATIALAGSKLNHIARMTVMMIKLLRKLYMCMKCANLMMILYVWMTCLEMIWLHMHPRGES